MSSFYAELEVAGHVDVVRSCQFEFSQPTGERGRPSAKVRHGRLQLSLDVPAHTDLLAWAAAAHKPLSGHVTFYETDERTARETVSFTAGHCVGYHETFQAGNTGAGAYVCHLVIATEQLTLKAGGADRQLLPAPIRDYQTDPPTAMAAMAIGGAPKKAPWLNDLQTVMGPAVEVGPAVARWVAGGLSEKKLQSAFRGSVDKRLVFERLLKAEDATKKGKGLYEQRIIIDNYEEIPGVTKGMYTPNGLLQLPIQAIDFGVDDPELDLPEFNAPTFASRPNLVELMPNETIYRVTNDPSISPFAKVGGYWTRKPPANLAEVIGGTAVMPEWNNFQRVYAFTVPPYTDEVAKEPKFYAWEGITASQPVSGDYPEKITNGYHLPGGAVQLFLPQKIREHKKYNFGDIVQDETSLHKSW